MPPILKKEIRTPRVCISFLMILGLSGCQPPIQNQPLIENSIGMTFVLIPAGEFIMGSDETAASLLRDFPEYPKEHLPDLSDEHPAHLVKITKDFYLGQHEVTVDQFGRFVAQSGYVPESIADGTGGYGFNPAYDPQQTLKKDAFEGRNPKYSWLNPGFAQQGNEPVVNVTWKDANALAEWLSEQEGVRYRLPTEAEWEYACRAGTQTRYFTGDDPEVLMGSANIFASDTAKYWPQWARFVSANADGYPFTSPVGSFKPNAFGLYDMLGNAWEWTADWYDENYYGQSPLEDPKGSATVDVKVRRGGSWHTWPLYARCSFRNWNTVETRYTLVGMRLLRETGTIKKPR